jgi:hypothetical protein
VSDCDSEIESAHSHLRNGRPVGGHDAPSSGLGISCTASGMRHADSKVTLEHYAHIVGDAGRVASVKFSQRLGQNINQFASDVQLESDFEVKTG